MTCAYCQHANTEEEHRCRRCGRRLVGTARPAPAHLATEHVRIAVRALGANALAAAQFPEKCPVGVPPRATAPPVSIDSAATADSIPRPVQIKRPGAQPSLFGSEMQPRIIPFETLPRVAQASPPPIPEPVVPKPAKPSGRVAAKKGGSLDETQSTLDFLPPLKNAPREQKTGAEAVIFCDSEVARPALRAMATTLDVAIIGAGFLSVLVAFVALARPETLDRYLLFALLAILCLAGVFYTLLYAIAGSVTPGMRWMGLRLINFDGFPPDGRSRALRLAGSWIGISAGGLGLLWALLDEEQLTWHDHMSKSFPTLRESDSVVVRSRM